MYRKDFYVGLKRIFVHSHLANPSNTETNHYISNGIDNGHLKRGKEHRIIYPGFGFAEKCDRPIEVAQ